MKKTVIIISCLLLSQAASISLFAQDKPQVGDTISGIVSDEYGPVRRIGIIEYDPTNIPFGLSAFTDHEGKFSFCLKDPEHAIHLTLSDAYLEVEDFPIDRNYFDIKLKHRYSLTSRMRETFHSTTKQFLPRQEDEGLNGKVSSIVQTLVYHDPYSKSVLESDIIQEETRTVSKYNKQGQLTEQEVSTVDKHANGRESIGYRKKTVNTYNQNGQLTLRKVVEYVKQTDGSISEQPFSILINTYKDDKLIRQTEKLLWMSQVLDDFGEYIHQTQNDRLVEPSNTFVQDFYYDTSGNLSAITMSYYNRGTMDSIKAEVRHMPDENGIMLVWGQEDYDKYLFDDKGRLLEIVETSNDGFIDMSRKYVYNEHGDLINTIFTDYGGTIQDKTGDYKYDRKGNWVEKTVYNQRTGYKPVKTYTYSRKIQYR